MNPDEIDALVHGDVVGARPGIDRMLEENKRLREENAALRRDAQRSHTLLAAALPEAEQNLRALLAKRLKDTHGETAHEDADMLPVDGWLIDHLLQLIQEEATRKLANLPTPRMVVETKGEARAIVEMMQKEQQEVQQRHDELCRLIAEVIMRPGYPWQASDPLREWLEKHPRQPGA